MTIHQTSEEQRLKVIENLRSLRQQNVNAFRYIAKVAAEHFKAPIAVVSIMDEKEQWFAGAEGTFLRSTPREHAFCAHTILSDEVLVVEDASKDPRFANNPLVTGEPSIRFYAGAPLVNRDGHRIGSVCIVDSRPRTMTLGQKIVLKNIAEIALSELERHAAGRQIV